jgi:hypothetical protein
MKPTNVKKQKKVQIFANAYASRDFGKIIGLISCSWILMK